MGKYTQLQEFERVRIYEGLKQGLKLSRIAALIARDKSTTSREIRRNSDSIGYLYPRDAHQKAKGRKAKHGSKINRNSQLAAYVREKLEKKWNPKAIAGRWSKEHPDKRISKDSIYNYIYAKEQKSEKLWELLPRKKRIRGLRPQRKKPGISMIKNRISIHQRPIRIEKRKEIGHYEADLMFHHGSMSKNILTILERKTRSVILIKNESKHSEPIIEKIKEKIGQLARSVTFDNGSEFFAHYELNKLNIPTFFCDPGSPWQKGSVENMNGYVRSFLPFGIPLLEITQEQLDHIANTINTIPRSFLKYQTPKEVLNTYKMKESRVKLAVPAMKAEVNKSFNMNSLNVALHV